MEKIDNLKIGKRHQLQKKKKYIYIYICYILKMDQPNF